MGFPWPPDNRWSNQVGNAAGLTITNSTSRTLHRKWVQEKHGEWLRSHSAPENIGSNAEVNIAGIQHGLGTDCQIEFCYRIEGEGDNDTCVIFELCNPFFGNGWFKVGLHGSNRDNYVVEKSDGRLDGPRVEARIRVSSKQREQQRESEEDRLDTVPIMEAPDE